MVANYHGSSVNLAAARKASPALVRGASFKTLADLGTVYGFEARGLQLRSDGLAELRLPAVLHWQHNHFVVLEKLENDKALIHDPNGYSQWLAIDDLDRQYSGFALELVPKEVVEFNRLRKKNNVLSLARHARKISGAISFAFILTIILQIAALAVPLFAQVAIDKALPEKNYDLITLLSVGFLIFLSMNAILTFIRLNTISKIGVSFGEVISADVTYKLFRLPIGWFRKRQMGEVLSKFHSIFPIKHVLSDDVPALLVNMILAVVTSLMMIIYSPFLSLIGLAALAIYTLIRAALLPRQKIALNDMIRTESTEHSFLLSSLQCMRSLRLSCREAVHQRQFEGLFKEYLTADFKYRRLSNAQKAIQTTLSGFVNVVVIWVAVVLAMADKLTPGMIFAILAYIMQFLAAGIEVVDKYSNIKELESHLGRLAEISDEPDDAAYVSLEHPAAQLLGGIDLIDVCYRYGDDGPWVLRSINLSVEPGQSIAITGPSGGGKSTLAQILLGLESPTAGQVLIDGASLNDFGFRNYYRQIAAVLQDEGLFHGSVQDNITLFDQNPDVSWIDQCISAAAMEKDVAAWPMGLQTNVGDLGGAVSSGQRQRILLARALYSRPRILVMDEGTAHLDMESERRVNESIKGLGITRIIFAHRAEAIAVADKVFVLKSGHIEEYHTVGANVADQPQPAN